MNDREPRRKANIDTVEGDLVPSLLANDIETTRERLRGLEDQHESLGALSGLSEAYGAIWHSDAEIEKDSGEFFLLEEYASSWCDSETRIAQILVSRTDNLAAFVTTLGRGHPLFIAPPEDVLDLLKASQPQRIRNRAWLVMYYSIILSNISSTEPENDTLKMKLRANLWLALNDVRLLLEPSEINIQALTLLASHVEEFTTPSLSWMLMTNACRMLQALGVNHRRLDAKTRERRTMMFWHLNLVDKGLALSLGRPPTFHRAMAREIPLPTLEQLLPFHPHRNPSTNIPSLFGAHLLQQVFKSTRMQADIWYCLYEDTELSERSIALVAEDLDAWYFQAMRVLEAAALVEKPFLDAKGAASVDLGVRTGTINYHYLRVLLAKSSSKMKRQCIESSRAMLHILDDMVSDSEEPFNGIIWQLVCRPFTPFLTLFGEILAWEDADAQEKELSLKAMERLPVFLNKMGLRNSLAAKLERVAVTFMQHARSIVGSSGLSTVLDYNERGLTTFCRPFQRRSIFSFDASSVVVRRLAWYGWNATLGCLFRSGCRSPI